MILSSPSLRALHERILACGLDWWNEDILKWQRKDPPCEPRGKVELLDLGRPIFAENAEAEIVSRGYDPATIEELCDYGTENPNAQRKNPIVALGSVFVEPTCDYLGSPGLCEVKAGRELRLVDRVRIFSLAVRFAVVHK